MTITAKFSSQCPNCGKPIRVGDRVEWSRGEKARHVDCGAAQAPASDTAEPQREQLTADQIVQRFAERLGARGGWLTTRQAFWLKNTWDREIRASQGLNAGRFDRHGFEYGVPRYAADGLFCDSCSAQWHLQIYANGAGNLSIEACRHRDDQGSRPSAPSPRSRWSRPSDDELADAADPIDLGTPVRDFDVDDEQPQISDKQRQVSAWLAAKKARQASSSEEVA